MCRHFAMPGEWKSCVIGGIALQRWGEPRVTRDVDLTLLRNTRTTETGASIIPGPRADRAGPCSLLTGFGQEGPFVQTLLEHYNARIAEAALFARTNRVLLLKSREGIGIDVSLGALPYEEVVISRATDFSFGPGLSLRTCSAEDLLVMKLFAFRPIDLQDAESVALRNKGRVDWDYVEQQLSPLAELKPEAEILRELARLKDAPAYPPT